MPSIIEELKLEHRQIERILMSLQFLVDLKIEDPVWRQTESEARRGILTNLRNTFAAHKKREDELLFPALERAFLSEVTALASVQREHAEIETLIAQLSATSSLEEMIYHGRRLAALLKEHFGKEERILYPMASAHLN